MQQLPGSWKDEKIPHTPKQAPPLIDCGIFSCLYAQCICECAQRQMALVEAGKLMKFTQADMPQFRKAFALALNKGSLIPLLYPVLE
jgi:Ulp1 family protease